MNELDDFKDLSQRLSSIMRDIDFTIGISDISNSTGIPQSKIRYWEKCDYISSVNPCKNQNRKYSYNTMIKIKIIQSFLDSGFTLSMAAKKASSFDHYGNLFHRFFHERLDSVDIIESYPAINLGKLNDNQLIYFIIKEDSVEPKLVPVESQK